MKPSALLTWIFLTLVTTILVVPQRVSASDNLYDRVDQLIETAAPEIPFARKTTDAEFLRRVYLDLAGRIPTVEETKAFLADQRDTRRSVLIDNLLSGPDYPRRMQELFHAMLMERRGDNADWTQFLRHAFDNNLPWHQVAAAIIKPDADNELLRGAAFFQTQRLVKEGAMAPVDVPGLTRDVGRLFAGIDLQCAQCHDHLTVDDYSQRDFQGLHMVFENVDIRRDVKFPAIGEKLMSAPKEFSSVFEQIPMKTGPVVPGGDELIIPTFDEGEEYAVPPDRKKKIAGIPKYSPLHELASGLASADNKLFCRNIVNRLWFQMMGRGLVEPLDLHHSENPATHPELLKLLADEFAAHDFNIRWLLRELAHTDVYQRSSEVPTNMTTPDAPSYAVGLEKRLSAEQIFWSLGTATREFNAVRRNVDHTRQQQQDTKTKSADSEATKPLDLNSAEQIVAASADLSELKSQFVKTFSNPPREPETDFNPTVAGALFLMHSEQILKLLDVKAGNLMESLLSKSDDESVLNELYLTVFSRPPSTDEKELLLPFPPSGDVAREWRIRNIAWAMLTSSEFMANH